MEKDSGYEKSARYYDIFASKEHVDFFLRYGRLYGSVLDIGAGTGLIAIPLATYCRNVYCVEPSEAMRSFLERKIGGNEELMRRVHLISADAETFKIERKFPFVIMSGSFEHIMDGDAKRAMHNIVSHMAEGAKMLFDVSLGAMRPTPLRMTDSVIEGKRQYKRYIGKSIEGDRIRLELVYETYEDGALREHVTQYSKSRVLDLQEVREALRDAGLSILNMFSDYDMKPFTGKEPLLIVEASKSQ